MLRSVIPPPQVVHGLGRPWGATAKMNELAETTVRECIGDGNYFVLESQFENCTKQFAVPRMQELARIAALDRTDETIVISPSQLSYLTILHCRILS